MAESIYFFFLFLMFTGLGLNFTVFYRLCFILGNKKLNKACAEERKLLFLGIFFHIQNPNSVIEFNQTTVNLWLIGTTLLHLFRVSGVLSVLAVIWSDLGLFPCP